MQQITDTDKRQNIKFLRVSRNNLFLIAACAWCIAGGILVWRGCVYFEFNHLWTFKLIAALAGGVLFFKVMFLKISAKHIERIRNLPADRPCALQFFGLRSYILMAVMITGGILLRTSKLVSNEYLSLFYFFMGTPLLLSAIRFFIVWKKGKGIEK